MGRIRWAGAVEFTQRVPLPTRGGQAAESQPGVNRSALGTGLGRWTNREDGGTPSSCFMQAMGWEEAGPGFSYLCWAFCWRFVHTPAGRTRAGRSSLARSGRSRRQKRGDLSKACWSGPHPTVIVLCWGPFYGITGIQAGAVMAFVTVKVRGQCEGCVADAPACLGCG